MKLSEQLQREVEWIITTRSWVDNYDVKLSEQLQREVEWTISSEGDNCFFPILEN